jgi:hypothetical protein
MTRLGTSPSLLVAGLALVVAVSGGTAAVAASLVTGAQIKDRSVTAVDVARNTLTGVEINETKLGVVPRATTADRLAGIASTGYLRSTRIESGTADFSTLSGSNTATVFVDSRLGLRVAYQNTARLYLQNLSATATIKVVGLGYFLTNIQPTQLTLAPGASTYINYDVSGFEFGTFLITSRRSPVTAAQVLQLTCAMDDGPAQATFSCVGVG